MIQNIKRGALLAALACFVGGAMLPLASVARADEPATKALPSGAEVIEKFIEATGGRDVYTKITSRVSSGLFEVPDMNIKGNFTLVQAAPDKGLVTVDLPGMGKTVRGSDGVTFWEQNPMLGVRLLEGAEKDQMSREFMFDADLNWQKFYKSAETVAIEDVDGKPAYKVILVSTSDNSPSTFYYDVASGLLVKMETTPIVQGNPMPMKATISGYKDFGGLKVPTETTQEVAGIRQKITISSVEHNKPVDPATFNLPEDVKRLKDKAAATQQRQ